LASWAGLASGGGGGVASPASVVSKYPDLRECGGVPGHGMAPGTDNDAPARASFLTVRPLRLLAILASAAACTSCGEETLPPAHLGPPESWVPLAEGRRWTYEAREGAEKATIA
jgi:hypothetical protein